MGPKFTYSLLFPVYFSIVMPVLHLYSYARFTAKVDQVLIYNEPIQVVHDYFVYQKGIF